MHLLVEVLLRRRWTAQRAGTQYRAAHGQVHRGAGVLAALHQVLGRRVDGAEEQPVPLDDELRLHLHQPERAGHLEPTASGTVHVGEHRQRPVPGEIRPGQCPGGDRSARRAQHQPIPCLHRDHAQAPAVVRVVADPPRSLDQLTPVEHPVGRPFGE